MCEKKKINENMFSVKFIQHKNTLLFFESEKKKKSAWRYQVSYYREFLVYNCCYAKQPKSILRKTEKKKCKTLLGEKKIAQRNDLQSKRTEKARGANDRN